MARHRAVPEPGTREVEPPGDGVEPAGFDPDRRVPRWLLVMLGLAVAVFVAGLVWAVSIPTADDEAAAPPPPAPATQIQDSGTPSPAPTSSPSPGHPSVSPSRSPSPSASTLASATGPATALAAVAVVQNSWTSGDTVYIQVRVDLTTQVTGVTGWRVILTCGPGSGLDVYNVWDAERASQAGAAATFGNASYDGVLTPGATTSFGFQATWIPADQQHQVPTCTADLAAR